MYYSIYQVTYTINEQIFNENCLVFDGESIKKELPQPATIINVKLISIN